jgi:hypothetical protein
MPAKKKRDLNQLAARIVEVATVAPSGPRVKQKAEPDAVRLGRRGGRRGGVARARKLTAARRRAIAKKAAEARWKK